MSKYYLLTISQCFFNNFISEKLFFQLKNKHIVILPYKYLLQEEELISFPENTERIYHFFEEKLPKNISIDICSEEDKFSEYAEHFDIISLGSFIIHVIALPIFINIISSYVSENYISNKKYGKENAYLEEPTIDLSLEIIQDDNGNSSTKLKYNGTLEGLNSILDSNILKK